MIPLDINSLHLNLKQQGYDASIQEDSKQLYTIFKLHNRDFPLFIKTDGQVLQLLIFMPSIMLPQAVADTARVLHLLNKEIDLPGFGMDEGPGVIFYRCVLPTIDGEVNAELFNKIVLSMSRIAQVFFPLLSSAASGTKFEAILGKARETLTKFAQAQQG